MLSVKKKIYFDQVDPGGIIYFVELYKLMHQVYEELLGSFDTEENYFESEKYVLPIIHAEADYIAPIRLHDEIIINVSVTQLKESSFELSYEIFSVSGKLVGKGKTVHVSVGKTEFKKIAMQTDLYNELKNHMQK